MNGSLLPSPPALRARIDRLFAEGRYGEAVPLARELLEMREAAPGADHAEVGRALNTLAIALHECGVYAEARSLLERALAITARYLGSDHPDHAMVLGNLARLLDDIGDPATARSLFDQAIASFSRSLGPDHPEVALALNNLGTLLHQQGDYAAAREQFERAAAILTGAPGGDHPDLAMVLNNLGRLHADLGGYTEARALLTRALSIHETVHGPAHPDVATSTATLASLLHEQGDFAAARPLYDRALQLLDSALGPVHLQLADILNDLGRLLHDQGDLVAAAPLYRRALHIREEVLADGHSEVAASLDNLAVLLHDQGDLEAARPLYERALAICETALGPNHPAVAGSLTNLGALRLQQGDPGAARPLYERALHIWEAAVGREHPDTALALHNLAAAHEETGEFATAGGLYERACAVWSAALGEAHPDVALCLRNLAALRWMEGDADAARSLLLRAAGALDRHASSVLPALAPAEQRAFVDMALGDLAGPMLSLADGPGTLAELYRALAGWKGLLLDGLRHQSAVAEIAGDPAHADDVAALRAARARVAFAFHAGEPAEALAALEAERERLERKLARALPADPGESWAGGVDGLKAALPPDSAFVDVYQFVRWRDGRPEGWRYGAVVIAPAGGHAFADLGPADEVEDAVEAWRASRNDERGGSALLEERVWEPVRAALPPGAARVWIAPDGALARVPLGILGQGAPAGGGRPSPGPMPAQVPSARALLRLLRTRPEEPAGPLLLVTDVDFGRARQEAVPGWPSLPGSVAEGRAIAAAARAMGIPLEALSGAAATPAAVAAAAPGATYLHVATHGYFGRGRGEEQRACGVASLRSMPGFRMSPPGRSPLAMSGLALAGANDGPHGNLSAEEIVGLRLDRTSLAVLSACDTGRGDEVPGQGVLGLQAAVQAAGARALLMSLWPVPDDATAALMGAFYRCLWVEGLTPAEALRHAQAAVRTRAGWGAPVCWAGWSLVGDVFRPLVPAPAGGAAR